ncbi:MAG: universal stress protein [Alphaproteobacteria bacterium]|nr:universal stress protein [Alphaproteobacteria bacterium]
MPIKSILVALDGGERTPATLETALTLVGRFGAHADVLHVRPDALTDVPAIGEGMSGQLADAVSHGNALRSEQRARLAREVFERVCGADHPSMTFVERVGRRHAVMARLGRVHDLILVGPPSDPRDIAHSLTMDALFLTGRPVLVVPHDAPASLGEHVAVAWNGSAECARALGGASNFLPHAKRVTILTAESARTPRSVVSELADYLARHTAAPVETRIIGQLGKNHLGGRQLLEAVHESGADLLVMGARKLGRLERLMLGSATQDVLRDADLPVLMGH